MNRRPSTRLSLYILLGAFLLLLSCVNPRCVRAQETVIVALQTVEIQVDRVIQIESGGELVISDTITLYSDTDQKVTPITNFGIGLPLEYNSNLSYFFAYDGSGRLHATLDTTTYGAGFSWVGVSFPGQIDVSNGRSYNFTLVLVFSGLIEANQTHVRAVFPAYPCIGMEANLCNVTIMLPYGAALTSASPDFSNKTVDSGLVLNGEKSPLEAYTNVSSWVEFTSSDFMILEVGEWKREIKIDASGGLSISDYYQLTNKAQKYISTVPFALPPNATDVSVQDVYGTFASSKVTIMDCEDYIEVGVSLREILQADQKVKLLIVYSLPSGKYIAQRSWQDYTLNASLVKPHGWIASQFTVTVSLPEGAEFQTSSKTPALVEKDGFLVKVVFTDHNVTKFHEQDISLEYRYLILWAFFRPALWVGTTAVLGSVVFFIRKRSRPTTVVAVPLSSEVLRRFVDTYEERRRLRSELGSLEQRVQKGKISRREYKLRRSSMDGRLSRLQKDLIELRREIDAAGGHYLDRMRRLETAEAEIETLDRDIERVEARFRRKEISTEAYRRLLDEYKRIRERAENTVAEILLRLREEIR